jgi:hypothetical protein
MPARKTRRHGQLSHEAQGVAGATNSLKAAHRDAGIARQFEVVNQRVDVLRAAERVRSLVEHREPVAAGGEEAVHRHAERVRRLDLDAVHPHGAESAPRTSSPLVLLVSERRRSSSRRA